MDFQPRWRLLAALSWVLSATACAGSSDSAEVVQAGDTAVATQLFTRMPARATGIHFTNRVRESRELNVFTYRNFFNGGGVGIGDLTGDGLPEIVLTSNQEGPKLFLNEGRFRFRDVTRAAGLGEGAERWTTGVALADVNGDGLLDIYISHAGPGTPEQRANELWINRGLNADSVPTFNEMARQYGIADEGYTTQAAFLDFDHDGDLDLFVLNNSPRPVSSFGLRNTRSVRDKNGGARLYRNDGDRFAEVGAEAGIFSPEIAFGLGVVVTDVNRDGWPDIYVANDFFERDYLYVNKRDGSFSESLDREMPVLSYFSMGLDAADVDNDGWADIYTTDMLPEDETRLKLTASFESWSMYQTKVRNGYHHQLMRNMLQRNNRDGTFSDIGQMAGVDRTDWSWSALIADLDLDGRKDIFVTNGIARDITSQDFISFLANDETMKSATSGGRSKVDFPKLLAAATSTRIPNYAFRNEGNLRFSNQAESWGLATPSFSSGAAYGDLDGDGAPDLVVNNVDDEVFVYRNNTRRLHPDNHFLQLQLIGEGKNRFAVGARATAIAGTDTISLELSPVRGFQSSVDYSLDFGLGPHARVDSLRIDWPDGRVSTMTGVATNERIAVRQAEAKQAPADTVPAARWHPFVDVTASATLDVKHEENDFVDFDRERLMPKLVSTEGPALAVADVNGDGLDDVFLGGAKEHPGVLLMQRRDGSFARSSEAVFARDAISEDVGAIFFDANGDGRPDLYVVSGGSEYSDGAPALQDRLYLNDGGGRFRKAEGHLPTETSSGSRVAAADYDGDGDLDLFVGGRVVPWAYGARPRSMLLLNDGRGHFSDVTTNLAPALERVGMVTDAIWRDVDADGRLDLVVVGEWMPITIFRNVGSGRLALQSAKGLEDTEGWWNRIVAGDFNGDGRMDFVVGNLGLNGRLRATAKQPVTMYVKDFDGDGSSEQIISVFNQGKSYPLALRDELIKALPSLGGRWPTHKDYADKVVTDIFSAKELESAVFAKSSTFATSIVLSQGDGSYRMLPLPDEAQLAPVYGLLAMDVDRDGHLDLLLAGNFQGFKPEIGSMMASHGLLLRGDSTGHFTPMRASESGFSVPGEARDIARLTTTRGEWIVVARNSDRPLVFRVVAPPRTMATRAAAGRR